jgi:hypothetical protein
MTRLRRCGGLWAGNETHAMPKNQPAPIHIRIDTQEQRSGIPDLLAAMPQVHIEVTPLHMGDYDVGGDPRRVFERKTGRDAYSRNSPRCWPVTLRPSYCWRGTHCASVIRRCALKAYEGR